MLTWDVRGRFDHWGHLSTHSDTAEVCVVCKSTTFLQARWTLKLKQRLLLLKYEICFSNWLDLGLRCQKSESTGVAGRLDEAHCHHSGYSKAAKWCRPHSLMTQVLFVFQVSAVKVKRELIPHMEESWLISSVFYSQRAPLSDGI